MFKNPLAQCATVEDLKGCIHQMHKWLSSNYSFIFVLIILTILVSMQKIEKNFHAKMRLVSLIIMKSPFKRSVYAVSVMGHVSSMSDVIVEWSFCYINSKRMKKVFDLILFTLFHQFLFSCMILQMWTEMHMFRIRLASSLGSMSGLEC